MNIDEYAFPPSPPTEAREEKRLKRKGEYIAFIPWAEAHGYKGYVLSGRDSASHRIYLRKYFLRAPTDGDFLFLSLELF